MNTLLIFWSSLGVVTMTYHLGKLILSFLLDTIDRNVQIGFSPTLFSFTVAGRKITIGLIIPLPYLLRSYSFDSDKKIPLRKPWQFQSVVWWQRLIATFGGTIALALVALLFLTVYAYNRIDSYIPRSVVDQYGIYPGELGREVGFLPGDRVLDLNGDPYERFSDLYRADLLLNDEAYYTILRNSDTIRITLPEDFIDAFALKRDGFLSLHAPFEVQQVLPGSYAHQIGLTKGDQILKINSDPIRLISQLDEALNRHLTDTVIMTISRQGRQITKQIIVPADGILGFTANQLIERDIHQKSVTKALSFAIKTSGKIIESNIRSIIWMSSGKVSRSARPTGGPISVGKIFVNRGAMRFLMVTATLMLFAVIFSFVPFPGSPFLSLIPFLFEALTGRLIPRKTMRIINIALVVLLLLLVLFSIAYDMITMLFG